MRFLTVLLTLLCLAAASPVRAEPPFPTTDFSGRWVVRDRSGDEMRATMNYSATDDAMRLEMAPGGMEMTAIRNMRTGEIVMWTSQMPGMGMRIATPADIDVEAVPTGEMQTVAGEACEIWTIDDGTACLGEGQVPLRTEIEGIVAELHDLKRGPQDKALFATPEGMTIMDMPAAAAMQGLKLPQLPF